MATRRVYALDFGNVSDAERVRKLQRVEEVLQSEGVKFEMAGGTLQAVAELSRSAGAPDYGPGHKQTLRIQVLPPYKWNDDGAWRQLGNVFITGDVDRAALEEVARAGGFTITKSTEMSRSDGGTGDTADPGEAAYREGDEWRRAELSRRGLPADPLQSEVDKHLAQTGLGQKALDARGKDRGAFENAKLSYHR